MHGARQMQEMTDNNKYTINWFSKPNPHCSRPSAHPLQLCVNFLEFRHAAHEKGPFLAI